jgi:hypothetical protein
VREPEDNIGHVCDHHAPKPGKYIGQEPKTFVGKFCKLGFDGRKTSRSDVVVKEHMWVKVERVNDQGELEGVLDNDPVLYYENGLACGDGIAFTVDEIEDVT